MRYLRRGYKSNIKTLADTLCEELHCQSSFADILVSRGFFSAKDALSFINGTPDLGDDPYTLPDMNLAVSCINQAITDNKRICVFGDYDVDGVCGTVILYKTLKDLGADVEWYIPDRHSEGYGIQEDSILQLFKKGIQFIITVDNGISSIRELSFAKSLGIKVVVTDHHRFNDQLPCAEAIVSSSRDDYSARINDLPGAGVAFMLARALSGDELERYLPYVALAIAADSVQVTGWNRYCLKKGMTLLKNDIYFSTLLYISGTTDIPVSMYTLNFILAPRINAAGRMKHASSAVEFFLAEDSAAIKEKADVLEQLNSSRKEEEARIYNDCIQMLSDRGVPDVIVLHGENWNPGVVGIAASRLSEKYHKNVLLLTRINKDQYAGSGRNDGQTDLFVLLSRCSKYTVRFGGHAAAAGMTISASLLDVFENRINEEFGMMYPEGIPEKQLLYDTEIDIRSCNNSLINSIALLEPFGPGNPTPTFRFPFVKISSVKIIGKSKEHLSCSVTDESGTVRMIAFNQADEYNNLQKSSYFDLIAELKKDSYNGTEKTELICNSLHSAAIFDINNVFFNLHTDFLQNMRYNIKCWCNFESVLLHELREISVSEEQLRLLYFFLKRRYTQNVSFSGNVSSGSVEEMVALFIFEELDFLSFKNGLPVFREHPHKKDINDSRTFKITNKD